MDISNYVSNSKYLFVILAFRLIHCSLSSEDARQAWVDAMREDNMVLANLLFILSSSTNGGS